MSRSPWVIGGWVGLGVVVWSLSVFAEENAGEKAGEKPAEKTSGDHLKQNAREAAQAVVDAGEKVSDEIQGKPAKGDGELVKGMRTNTGRGYGTAGCGLGSIIFEPGSGFTQVLAATTNASFGTQTFGITSGTSNCTSPRAGTAGARAFIESNRSALAKDIARGQGETLASLSRLAGCADTARVGQRLQQRFGEIFPSASQSDEQVSGTLVNILRSDGALECRGLAS